MERESPIQASTPTGAVFLSYASEDAEAAKRICEALRAGGIEVWLDQSELRGGDAWDHKIRDQIHDCRLFISVISANTERRDEGYFRREWSLAVERTRDMVHRKTFLVPVVIDGTPERGAAVPDKFHELQWTRLPGGEAPSAFVDWIRRLLTPDASPGRTAAAGSTKPISVPLGRRPSLSKAAIWGASAIAAVACAYFVADRFGLTRHAVPPAPSVAPAAPQTGQPAGTAAGFNPPPHSVAVLPFVNMSGDKDQEYFSDGLTEELLNSLSRINDLQVAARTSSFSFKGKDTDIDTVAHKLNVGAVLEGSVRRSAHTMRVTAQLINAVTGFHMWSETYDRNLGDALKLQSEIATAVASALKVTLLGNEAARIEVGGTRNAEALDAYLRAANTYWATLDESPEAQKRAIAGYTDAINLDPSYALAYAARSIAYGNFVGYYSLPKEERRASREKAQSDARKAIELAPDIPEGHMALALLHLYAFEFTPATKEFERALALGPGNARVMRAYGNIAAQMGRENLGLTLLRRAAVLDPLNVTSHQFLGFGLAYSRHYEEAIAAFKRAEALSPGQRWRTAVIGIIYYLLGNLQAARSSCEGAGKDDAAAKCLALTYYKLGQHADAETMLAKLRASEGVGGALDYAQVYAQWGDTTQALESLETAMRLRLPDLLALKTNPLLDPLRKEARFQAIERTLKFPD